MNLNPFVRPHRAILFSLATWAAATTLCAQNPAPPPIPAVAPLIGKTYSNDTDGDRIDDQLAAKSRQAQVAQAAAATAGQKAEAVAKLNAKVEVELVFAEQITRKQMDDFVARGGEITHIYKAVSYGWNARISLSQVAAIPALMGAKLLLIQEAVPIQLHMDKATQTGRVRPVWAAGFAGNVSGFDGDSTITIAIVDTGVDESHPDLNGRRVYWHDFSSDALASPADPGQHGSHVAGIALGSGAAGGSGAGTLSFTQEDSLNGAGNGSFIPNPIELPASSITATMTATWNGGGNTTLYWLSRPRGSSTWDIAHGSIAGTSPLSLSTPLTGDLNREYSPGLVSNGHMNDFVVKCQVTNYPAAGDGFNKMRGVAPGCNWAGAKVFTNAGSGSSTAISAAVDTLVANRAVNNIKVMNLSLGTIGSPGLNTAHRQKINSAVNNGIVVAVSAGNDGGTQQVDDPGRAAMALTVAASNDINQLTGYTNEGFASPGSVAGQEEDYKPDLMAPGGSGSYYSSILSVDSNSGDGTAFSDQQANDYLNIQGTSMASPFAAGCAALVIDALQQSGVTWDFASSQHSRYVKMILCATASESNSNRESAADNPTLQRATAGPNGFPAGKDQYEGYGMINPDAAVEAATLSYSLGSTATAALGPAATDRRVWARKVSLAGSQACQPTLTVPAGADFDFYLYSATPNAYGTPVLLASSTAATSGGTETFTYTPASATTGLLVVKRTAGSGTFSLSTPGAAPILSNIEGANLIFTENQTSAAITATLTVSDSDSSSLSSGTVSITAGFASGQDVLAMTPNPQNGISASYAPATGVLTLSGSSSVADYQVALRSVTYVNTSENPSTVTRTVTFSASDGTASGSGTRSITVTAVNDAPALTTTAGALAYTENQAATAIDGSVTVTDSDSTNFTGATVAITANFAGTGDVLGFTDQGGITGSYNTGTGVLTLSGPATVATYQTALRTVTYLNGSENPSPATRTITFTANDGAASNNLGSATRNITVAAVNDAPAATNLSASETYTEDTALDLTDIVVSDVDSASVSATLIVSNVAAGALNTATSGAVTSTYSAGTGVWTASGAIANVNTLLAGVTFNPAANFDTNFTIATSVTDGVAAAITGSKAMTGIPVNDTPTLTNLSAAETYTEDSALDLTDIVVSDVDSASVTVTLTVSNVAAGALSTATSGAVTSTYNAGTGVWTASGAISSVNTLLVGVTFNPAVNFDTNFTIATSVTDGVAPAITGNKAMTGIPVNDAPINTVPLAQTTAEDTGRVFSIGSGNALLVADPDSTSLAVTLTAKNGTASLASTAGLTFTQGDGTGDAIIAFGGALASINAALDGLSFAPTPDFDGAASLTIASSDGAGSDTDVVTLNVTAVNDFPTLDNVADPAAIVEDAGVQTVNLSSISAGGGEAQSLTVTATSDHPTLVPNPAVTYTSPNGSGSLSYTPVANAFGSATITVTVDDGQAANNTVTRTFTVNVTAVNDPPTLAAISDPAPILEDATEQTINLSGISAGGGESQTLTVTATSDNTALIPNPTVTFTNPDSTGSLSYTPVANAFGSAAITVTVDDGQAANNTVTRTFTVNVTAVNDVPTLAAVSDPAPILEDGAEQTINLSGISAGGGESQTLTVAATSDNTAIIPNPIVTFTSPDATGSLSYTPVANAFGSAAITVTVDDGQAANNTVTRTFTVNVTAVNDVPTLAAISDPAPILEDAGEQAVNLSGISAGGGEAQTLTVAATSSNTALISNPVVTYTSPDATGSFSYTPAPNASGSATITVTVDDGQAVNNNVTRTFTVNVTAVNDAPTLAAVSDPASILEDGAEQTINLSGISAGGGESQTLTVAATSDNTAIIPNPTVTFTSPDVTGSLSYTPVANAFGSATITVTVDDGQAVNNTVTRTFTVTVAAVNDAPTLAAISDPAPILEDAGEQTINLSGISTGGGEVQTLTVAATSDNTAIIPNPTVTFTSPDVTGSLSYTPVANAFGSATITVTVDDGQAANNTVTRTFTVNVTAVNDVPTLAAVSDPAPILEDGAEQTINLSGISAGGGEAQTLTVTATSNNTALILDPAVTFTSPDATGSLSYTPVPNAFGSATITVTVDDGQAANNTVTRTFTVHVTAVNDAPTLTAISDPAPILEDAGEQTINLSGISAGGGESQTLTVTASSGNTELIPHPAVTFTSPDVTGSLSYTPVPNAFGSATITVTVDDGQAANNTITRTFTVNVTAVNDAPTLAAISDPAPFLEDAGEQTINLSGISAGGGESQTLTVTAMSDNTALIPNPTVTYTSPDTAGSLSYTPVANAFGSALITVTVDDGQAANNTVTRTFIVTVTAPVIVIEQPGGTRLTDGTSTVDFGTRLVGTGADRVFTVRNAGTANLTGIGITFDGVNAGDFSITAGAAATVSPGTSTSFTVRFRPASGGQRAAMLHIASNDPDANPFDIALSGTAITPIENWRQIYFGTTANTGDAADAADPNGNGIANIVEYALNGNPTGFDPGQNILPSATRGGTGCVQLSFSRYPDRTDVILTVQAADSPGGPWTDLAISTGGGMFTVLTAGAEVTETGTGPVRDVKACDLYNIADPGHPRRFMKLEITLP